MLKRRQVKSPIKRGRHICLNAARTHCRYGGSGSNTCCDISHSTGASNSGFSHHTKKPPHSGCCQHKTSTKAYTGSDRVAHTAIYSAGRS